MEVHAHTHTERKKWTHYLWEFLMLFLAVFSGFLAENFREHLVEHQREKKYMISFVEDLETDTMELRTAIGKCDSAALYSDSVLMFLASYKPSREVPLRLATQIGFAGQRLILINTDRTSSQLKNSGALRLIRNTKVNNEILRYWKQINETNITLDRYIIYRNAGREILFRLSIIPEVYQRGLSMPADSIKTLRVIDTDPKKWDELTNLIAISGSIARTSHMNNLKKQLELAKALIVLINKEYHLK
ncbi:MAG TPA: hypothetical protein VIV35_08450 [Chitinophagaceae bacterium]